MGTEFADNDTLGSSFKGQRDHDALEIIPFIDNQTILNLANGTDRPISRILTGTLEAIEAVGDGLKNILVARSELVAEAIQNREVDLVGAMRIGGMNGGLKIAAVIVEDVKDIVALMLICANNPGRDGDMVGNQGVGHHAFLQAEVFWGMPGVESRNTSLKALPITARMQHIAKIVMVKDRQVDNRVGHEIIGRLQGLRPNEIIGCASQSVIANVRNSGHAS